MKRRIILLFTFLSLTSLYSIEIDYSNYKKFTTYTNTISLDGIKSQKVIFFGAKEKYQDFNQLHNTSIISHSLNGLLVGLGAASTTLAKSFLIGSKDLLLNGLSSGLSGFGLGLIMGSIDAYSKGKKNEEYDKRIISRINKPFYLVEDIENNNSEKSRKISMVTIAHLYNNTKKEKIDLEKIKSILIGK